MKYFSGNGLKNRHCEEKGPAIHTAEPPSNTEKERKVEKEVNTEQVKGQKWKRSNKK